MNSMIVKQLAEKIEAELIGSGSAVVDSVGTIEAGQASCVTFVTDKNRIAKLGESKAAAVICAEKIDGLEKPQLIVKDVNAALLKTLKIFAPKLKPAKSGIDSTAKIGENVKIAEGVSIGAFVVIDDQAQVGANSIIESGCRIGENTKIGENCRFDSNVVIYHNCKIGNNVIIQANSVIGSTGFGYVFTNGSHQLMPHNGGVVIEDFVEIGANSCVDRAKFGNTIIGAGTKIDNLVQIAHNVVIGKCCLIVAQVGIAGSSKLGDGVVMAGQSGAADNLEIGDGVMAGAQSAITHNIPAGKKLFGSPAFDSMEAFKVIGLTKRLPKLFKQVKQLEKQMEKLKEE